MRFPLPKFPCNVDSEKRAAVKIGRSKLERPLRHDVRTDAVMLNKRPKHREIDKLDEKCDLIEQVCCTAIPYLGTPRASHTGPVYCTVSIKSREHDDITGILQFTPLSCSILPSTRGQWPNNNGMQNTRTSPALLAVPCFFQFC